MTFASIIDHAPEASLYAPTTERLDVAPRGDDRLRRVHLGMIDAVLAGEGGGRVAALAARELDGPVAIVLPAHDVAVIAPARPAEELAHLRGYVSDRLLGLPVERPRQVAGEVPVTSGGDRLGSVLLLGEAHPAADEVLRLAALAAVTSVALEQGAVPRRAHERRALLEQLRETPPPLEGEILARARRLGCELGAGASALCVRAAPGDAEWAVAVIAQEAPGALVAPGGELVEALLPGDRRAARRLAARLGARVAVGLSPLERDVRKLGAALRHAELALALAEREGLAIDELDGGSWRLLLRVAATDPDELVRLVEVTVGPVLDPAISPSLDLPHTLRTYVAHDASMKATAGAIYAHRHTVGYRLRRITELTGHDPATASGLSQLALGLRALSVCTAAGLGEFDMSEAPSSTGGQRAC